MDLIENLANAAKVLQSALRVLALPPEGQILLFNPDCVACRVRNTYDLWEEQFAASDFVREMTTHQHAALQQVREATASIRKSVECNSTQYLCYSPDMAAARQIATKALAAFDWSAGEPELAYVYGTPTCGDRLQLLHDRKKQEQLDSRRMEPANSRYHAATFRLHGHSLLVNRTRQTEIERWEAQFGLKLPGAVREWYAMEGPDLWERIRPRDQVPPLDKLEPLRPALVRSRDEGDAFLCLWGPLSDADLIVIEAKDPFSYLLVMSDTDVGIPALVRIDGSDDPPVLFQPDGSHDLHPTSPRYSVFQFDQLADQSFGRWNDGSYQLEVKARLPNGEELARLRAALAEGPQSRGGWPGWHYRFCSQHLLIACGHDYYEQPAEVPFWEIRAESDEALVQALRILQPIADVVEQLTTQDPAIAQLTAQMGLR